ncbi:glucosyltransferase domain-containing protein [Lachnospiraceae bacterium OttesenSCG-928-D06]|nr:glucosyltransferase domain-containing protein [Lachnospiraceae bacterium OttesenSCG-928-D06]
MKTPQECYKLIKENCKIQWKTAFFTVIILGLLIHMPIMVSDIQNHDGLASMYFDQNMITSGRFFLGIACGISSYYNLPWLIGVLSLIYLGLGAVALVAFLEVKNLFAVIGISGLLVAFPSIASTFSYVFTMDGYMMAVLFSVLAVLFTKKYKHGYLLGGICLALSMGIYQSYLPFTIILCIYGILITIIDQCKIAEIIKTTGRYLIMGISGVGLYFIILKILLFVQGKELDTYQGINGMGQVERKGLLQILKNLYGDFFAFTIKGNVFFGNPFAVTGVAVIFIILCLVIVTMAVKKKWWKKPGFYAVIFILPFLLPIVSNVILVISSEVTYHLLMRYQWVLYLILPIAFVERYGRLEKSPIFSWAMVIAVFIVVFQYGVTDNIAYSNLEKRYEKTYGYCLRLLDRIEQTSGYYQGIPIAMVGVVSDEEYPLTDITGEVTSGMIGIYGDSLLYRPENYQQFMEFYLGASLNFLPAEVMGEIYYSESYKEMQSFPGEDSIRIVDGIMYIKTENVDKTLIEDKTLE